MSEVILRASEVLKEGLDQLKPFFQPIVEVSSGNITGYEALARFEQSDGTVVSAGHFFTDPDINIESKLLMDRCVREKAILKAAELPDQTRMTLNISPQWLSMAELDSLLTLEMLNRHGIDSGKIVIELIEVSGDIVRIEKAVKKYREAGLRVAIDDFGAGFSQLDRVIALEPDIIKLDMRLFQQGAQGGMAESVVESLVNLCTKSGAVIVCEGVETEEEFFFGLRCGARHMQGFLFSGATQNFIHKGAFKEQVAMLRQRFFERQKAKSVHEKAYYKNLMALMNAIKEHHLNLSDLNVDFVSQQLESDKAVIRFYASRANGEQFTANYSFLKERNLWSKDDKFTGFNWSWRPYLYQLFAGETMVMSQNYLDIETATPCKTFSMQLNENMILMVDVEVF